MRAVEPGALFFCVRGQRIDGHDFARRGGRERAPWRWSSSDRSTCRFRSSSSRTRAQAMAEAAGEFFGHPSHELSRRRRHRHERQDDDVLPALRRAGGRGPAARACSAPSRRGSAASGGPPFAHDAGGDRPAAHPPRDARRGRPQLRDGGDVPRLGAGTPAGARFAALVFTNLTQDHLDLHGTMERYFDAKRRLFVDGRSAPGRGQRRRRLRAAACRRAARARTRRRSLTFALDERGGRDAGTARARRRAVLVSSRPASSSNTPLLGRFNVENVLGAVAAARLLGLPDEAIARGMASVRGVPGRFEPVDEGQPFLVVVDYCAHARLARDGACARRETSPTGARHLRVRLRRRPRPRQAPADGQGRIRGGAISRSSPPTTRGARTPTAIIARSCEGVTGGGRGGAGPGGGDRAGDRRGRSPATSSSSPARGTSRGRRSAGETVPFDDREVAREALRRLGARA